MFCTPLLQEQLRRSGKRKLHGALARILPKRLAETVLTLNHIPPDRRMAEVTRTERRNIVRQIKQTEIPLLDSLGFKKAEVTAGGIDAAEDAHLGNDVDLAVDDQR